MKRIWIAVTALALVVGLTACKEVDKDAVHARKVVGTDTLYSFCDGTTLIYFTDVSGSDDEFEAFWLGGCTEVPSTPKPGQGSETTGGDR